MSSLQEGSDAANSGTPEPGQATTLAAEAAAAQDVEAVVATPRGGQ